MRRIGPMQFKYMQFKYMQFNSMPFKGIRHAAQKLLTRKRMVTIHAARVPGCP